MRKKNKRIVIKQLLKYALLIISFLTFFMIYRLLGNVDQKIQVGVVILGSAILIISLLFDLASARDIIPILKN